MCLHYRRAETGKNDQKRSVALIIINKNTLHTSIILLLNTIMMICTKSRLIYAGGFWVADDRYSEL